MVHRGCQKPQHISDLIPDGIFIGTSLILHQDGRFLYGVRPPRIEGSQQVMELTGIGGGMEEEDESLTAGVLRETREEIGCGVRLLPCDETMVVHGQDDIERVVLKGEERPAAAVFHRYRTPPHHPWHEDNQGEACLVVFLAELEGHPQPMMELPALIWLKPSQVVETARRDVLLRELLDSGAELVQGEGGKMPEMGWIRMTDSQEALALALGDDALSFYEELPER